jgi:hypothetical protein
MYFTDILNKVDISFEDEVLGGLATTTDWTEGDVQMGDAWYPQFEQTVKRGGSTLDASSLHRTLGKVSATAVGGAVRYNTREDSIRTELLPGPQTREDLISSGKLGRRWEDTGPRFSGRPDQRKKNLTPSFPAGFVRTSVAKKGEVFKQREEEKKAEFETQQIIPPPPLVVYQAPNSAAARLWDSAPRGLGAGLSPRVAASMEGKYQLLQLAEAGNTRGPTWRDISSKSERANLRCQTAHQIACVPLASRKLNTLVRQAPVNNGEWERQPEAKDFMPRMLRKSGSGSPTSGANQSESEYAVGSAYKARRKGRVATNYAAAAPSAVRCDSSVKSFWEGWDHGRSSYSKDMSSSKKEIFDIIMQEPERPLR